MLTNQRRAAISGIGVAAAACHALLRRFDWQTTCAQSAEEREDQTVPFIAINDTTWKLLADVFGKVPLKPWVTTRRLVGRYNSETVFAATESHFIVPAEAVRFPELIPFGALSTGEGHHIETRTRGELTTWISSGQRAAWVRSAESLMVEAANSLVLEFVPGGWVFWMPIGSRKGILQWMAPDIGQDDSVCTELWLATKIIRNWVAPAGEWHVRALPAAARIKQGLMTPEVTFCGSAAMRFDPISGDGTGASLRSAILSCAAIRYLCANPGRAGDVFEHYESRILGAFRDHLSTCIRHYSEAGLSHRWDTEQAAMKRAAIAVAGNELPRAFLLKDLSLKTI